MTSAIARNSMKRIRCERGIGLHAAARGRIEHRRAEAATSANSGRITRHGRRATGSGMNEGITASAAPGLRSGLARRAAGVGGDRCRGGPGRPRLRRLVRIRFGRWLAAASTSAAARLFGSVLRPGDLLLVDLGRGGAVLRDIGPVLGVEPLLRGVRPSPFPASWSDSSAVCGIEQEGHDVAGDRRGRAGAEPAVLDHDRHGITRGIGRREADEQRVVARFPVGRYGRG